MEKSVGAQREELSHVRWLCGSSLSGKTTIARKLEEEYDVELFPMDRHLGGWIQRIEKTQQPNLHAMFVEHSFFDTRIWPRERRKDLDLGVCDEAIHFAVEELAKLRKTRLILVEGVFLPEKVCAVAPAEHVACIALTDNFYHEMLEKRMENIYDEQQGFYTARVEWKKAHPQHAELLDRNETESWLWLRSHMEREARKAQVRVITNDGSRTIDELAAIVREHFEL